MTSSLRRSRKLSFLMSCGVEVGRASWVQPVLGEPGAGKSRLLREWALRMAVSPAAGVPFAFVPLRSLVAPDGSLVAPDDYKALAARLLGVATETARAIRLPYTIEGQPTAPRVWLLDGLDELPEETWGSGFSVALTALPGPKVATCRTGVFAGWRQRLSEGVGAQWRKEVEILPLGVRERRAFLAHRLPERDAEALAIHIEASASLRGLAGSPLLLALMAELGLPLPESRVTFYERTEARLGARRSQGPQHDLVWARSGAVLDRLADEMKLNRIEAPLALLMDACASDQPLYDALRSSGILTIDRDRACFAFIHLTFQEYHLARALQATGSAAALKLHWREASYEETLALLLAMEADADSGPESVAAALDGLVRTGLQLFRDKPEALFQLGRSPIRVALHLLGRSGTDRTVLPKVKSLWPVWKRFHSFKEAVAVDERSPPAALETLARDDPDEGVRKAVARNPSTPAAALETLARDPDIVTVRWRDAENPSTPAAALETLARDPDEGVREAAARNPSTSAAALETLARDPDKYLRQGAAQNPSTPAAAVETLARDPDEGVRKAAAQNPSTPAAALETLARDPDYIVRLWAAMNPSTPAAALEALARDPDHIVRWWPAMNRSTPAAALETFARDPDKNVRQAAAQNPSTSAGALETLTRDWRRGVRSIAAWNPSTLLETLCVSRFTKWIWRCRRVLVRPVAYFAPSGSTGWLFRQGVRSIAAEASVAVKNTKEGFWQAIGAALLTFLIALSAWFGAHEWATFKVFWASLRSFLRL